MHELAKFPLSLAMTVAIATACHGGDDDDTLDDDDYGHDEACGNCPWEEERWDDDWDGAGEPTPPEDGIVFVDCMSHDECGSGFVCSPADGCIEHVADCPLTDECLGDPEGYTPDWPDWQGIDPLFVGTFSGDGVLGMVEVMLDFYDDHIYGELAVVVDSLADPHMATLYSGMYITGSRDGIELWGQVIHPSGERSFDAVFEAVMSSASEITGAATIASDAGELTATFELLRISPCGCENTCESDADCPENWRCADGQCTDDPVPACTSSQDCANSEICVDGVCTSLCCRDADCPQDQICVGNLCVTPPLPEPDPECSSTEDCAPGQVCLNGECLIPCGCGQSCDEGEQCQDGVCVPIPEPEPIPCTTSCDCPAGQVCSEGTCAEPEPPAP